MGNNTYKKLIKDISEAQELKEKERERLNGLINSARATADKATAEYEKAMADTNAEAYTLAKREKIAAADAVELYEKKLAELERKALFESNEADTRCREIINAQMAVIDENSKEVFKLLKSIETIIDNANAELAEGNEIIKIITKSANSVFSGLNSDLFGSIKRDIEHYKKSDLYAKFLKK